ncbi:MAG: hypothetical protein KUG58_07320 [Marinosulfonomonas sp.]|nr:hypothetical protein [Marinosulfonomonas sp.]
MLMAVILLGLVPLAILPDFLGTDASQGGDDENLDDGPEMPTDNILEPTVEDDGLDSSDKAENPKDILTPVIEDDLPSLDDIVPGDILLPVDEIESEADTIFINFEEFQGSGYAEIEDFEADSDILHVLIDPDTVEGELEAKVVASDNGQDADVYIEDYRIAVLKGAADATEDNVFVEVGKIN